MTEEVLAAIGRVCVEYSLLEMQLEAAIWSVLVGTKLTEQAAGRIVTSELSFQKSLHLYQALYRHRFPDRDDTELGKVCAQAGRAEAERNVVIHSTWWQAEEGKVMRAKTTAKGKLKTTFEKLSASDVTEIAKRLHQAAEEVMNFHVHTLEPESPRLTL